MQLLWLRNDLRLHDHPGFHMAIEQNEPLAVVYILPDHWLTPTEPGFNRLGIIKARFLRATLMNLHRTLARENIRLTLVSGNPAEQLLSCYGKQPFTLLTQSPKTMEESVWFSQIQRQIPIKTYEATTLFTKQQLEPLLLRHDQHWLRCFSTFRQRVHDTPSMIVEAPAPPLNLRLLDWMPDWPGNLRWPDDSEQRAHRGFSPIGGEDAGTHLLAEYLQERLTDYSQPYSDMHPPLEPDGSKTNRTPATGFAFENNVHHISPYLAWGALSPRYVWHRISHHPNDSRYDRHKLALQNRLLRREYHHWSMQLNKHHPSQCHVLSRNLSVDIEMKALQKRYWAAWCAAKTGIPMIDAGLKALTHSGFVPHWLRHCMAHYFIHALTLDWQRGMAFFEQHLVDFDATSNQENWLIIANSRTTPAKERDHKEKRVFNLNQQLQQHDVNLAYIRQWLPELASTSLEQVLCHQSGQTRLAEYVQPIVTVYSNEPHAPHTGDQQNSP